MIAILAEWKLRFYGNFERYNEFTYLKFKFSIVKNLRFWRTMCFTSLAVCDRNLGFFFLFSGLDATFCIVLIIMLAEFNEGKFPIRSSFKTNKKKK